VYEADAPFERIALDVGAYERERDRLRLDADEGRCGSLPREAQQHGAEPTADVGDA
jgi:hypothetical protein